jgi:hypothetical protein
VPIERKNIISPMITVYGINSVSLSAKKRPSGSGRTITAANMAEFIHRNSKLFTPHLTVYREESCPGFLNSSQQDVLIYQCFLFYYEFRKKL